MLYNIEIYFLVFLIYSILGWIMECTLGIIEKHKFVNRGFLIGPYCPIYGVGVVGVTLLLSGFTNNLVLLFILSTILCGSLEYFTSYIMEKLFHARWWDYTNRKFNINGRICLETLLPFGIISVLILKYLNPFIFNNLYKIPLNVLMCVSITLFVLYLIDTVVSLKIISNFKDMTKQAKDNTEEISKKVKETAEVTIAKLTKEKELIMHKMRIKRYSVATGSKYTRNSTKYKVKNIEMTLVGKFKKRIQEIDESIRKSAKDVTEKIKENQLKIRNDLKEKFVKKSKLNKRLISAFPNVEHREYTRKKRDDK